MRAPVRIRALTQEEYSELKRMERSRKLAAGRVKRAQIILLSNQGYLAHEIARKLDIHEKTARRWVGRFNKLGMPGLEEGPRNGRPKVYSTKDVGVVIQTALTSPEDHDLPSIGGLPGRGEGRPHQAQPHKRDLPQRWAQVAAPGGVVRRAGGSRLRRKNGGN